MGSTEQTLSRLNAVRILVVLIIAFGYASTMPMGPGNREYLAFLGMDPSWIGIQVLFFLSGYLALRSIRNHGSPLKYLASRTARNYPLLILFTLIAVLVIYPLFGVMDEPFGVTAQKLGRYFFETVSCLNPGQPLPGLLDEAKYMCIIQGAVWTFKWGVVAHIGVAIGAKLKLLKHDWLLMIGSVIATAAYFSAAYVFAKTGNEALSIPVLGFRLAHPFLIGMTVYAYKDRLPAGVWVQLALFAAMFGGAAIWYNFFIWTPAIEILLCLGFSYLALLLATAQSFDWRILRNWPNLALGIYLANWPTAQILLLQMPGLNSWELIALTLPISVLIAAAAHALVSKPVMSWTGLGSHRTPAPA